MIKRIFVLFIVGFISMFYFSGNGLTQESKRPFYEYPGNYREEINQLKAEFVNRFGYELIDLEHEWRPWEIKKLVIAFSKLPETFLKIKGENSIVHKV